MVSQTIICQGPSVVYSEFGTVAEGRELCYPLEQFLSRMIKLKITYF